MIFYFFRNLKFKGSHLTRNLSPSFKRVSPELPEPYQGRSYVGKMNVFSVPYLLPNGFACL